MFLKEGGVFVGGRTENAKPKARFRYSDRGDCHGNLHTMGLSHIVVRVLGKATPAHQVQPRRARRGGTPVQSQQLALDPEGSGVTMNIRPSLMKVIGWNYDACDPSGRPTWWKDLLRLILLGEERLELCRVRTKDNDIVKTHTFLKYGFWNSP